MSAATPDTAPALDLQVCPRVAKMFKLQWEEVQQCWVLLYPEGMVKLNGSAGEIMSRIDGNTSVQGLISALEQQFETTGLRDDVLDFLAIAKRQGWVNL
ncbi:pyrroloquinoline quinone biosynthesis peptide chaperone PqqD [Rhodoferax sp. OV413]|uniref:pyrroloquinoline quinone biosynthesis peptide chaperone PqqD n=1 Tax=Rhodoferax sp. OV413 TaxID=1855285 RepID=UPI0025CF8AD1|nr:pyrroloquinoline quinone biosynthesis peptide chaperone PqqD [Rhodoferax sp. OV413]